MTINVMKECAKGAAILTLGGLGTVILMVGAFAIGGPIYGHLGLWGIIVELVVLMFLVPFLGGLFSQRFFEH